MRRDMRTHSDNQTIKGVIRYVVYNATEPGRWEIDETYEGEKAKEKAEEYVTKQRETWALYTLEQIGVILSSELSDDQKRRAIFEVREAYHPGWFRIVKEVITKEIVLEEQDKDYFSGYF